MDIPTPRERIQKHLQDHRIAYLIGGTFCAGMIVRGRPEFKQIIGSFNYKSTTTNIIQQDVVRRGHPGFKTLNLITGERAASINRMAEIDGVSWKYVKDHMKGSNPTYANLGEM